MLKKIGMKAVVFLVSWFGCNGVVDLIFDIVLWLHIDPDNRFGIALDTYMQPTKFPLLFALVITILDSLITNKEENKLRYCLNMFIGWEFGYSILSFAAFKMGADSWEWLYNFPIIGGVVLVIFYKIYRQRKKNKEIIE